MQPAHTLPEAAAAASQAAARQGTQHILRPISATHQQLLRELQQKQRSQLQQQCVHSLKLQPLKHTYHTHPLALGITLRLLLHTPSPPGRNKQFMMIMAWAA
jgi:hypothetical protein